MRRRALVLAPLAIAAASIPLVLPAIAAPARTFSIRIDCAALKAVVDELVELLPLSADCDVGTRARFVELFEQGNRFFDAASLDGSPAIGTGERLIVLQPSRLLLLCVTALRAQRGKGDAIHQSHSDASVERLATPTMAGRGRGVESLSRSTISGCSA
jgi:hypothetical protein